MVADRSHKLDYGSWSIPQVSLTSNHQRVDLVLKRGGTPILFVFLGLTAMNWASIDRSLAQITDQQQSVALRLICHSSGSVTTTTTTTTTTTPTTTTTTVDQSAAAATAMDADCRSSETTTTATTMAMTTIGPPLDQESSSETAETDDTHRRQWSASISRRWLQQEHQRNNIDRSSIDRYCWHSLVNADGSGSETAAATAAAKRLYCSSSNPSERSITTPNRPPLDQQSITYGSVLLRIKWQRHSGSNSKHQQRITE